MFTPPVLGTIAATVALGTYWAVRLLKNQLYIVRILCGLSSLGLAGILLRLVALTASAPLRQWNGARLAPLMAVWKGFPLYGDPQTGVLSAWIYGPISVLVYLPASLLNRPTSCILLGVVLSVLMILTPAFFAMNRFIHRDHPSGRLIGPLMMGVFLCIVMRTESLADTLFYILSDAPMIALVASACLLLMGPRKPRSIAASAVMAVLACWTKQTVLPFVIVPLIFLLLVGERRAAKSYVGWLLGSGAVISIALIGWFGVRGMWFYMVTVPSHQPFQYAEHGTLSAILRGIKDWAMEASSPAIPIAVTLLIAAILRFHASVLRSSRLSQICSRRPWTILLMAALILLPSGILGYIKVSGSYNNFGTSLFLLLLAGCIGVIDLWQELAQTRPTAANWIICCGCVFLLVRGITADATTAGALDSMGAQIESPSHNPQEIMFDFDRAHPAIGYFPWDPLPALLAEGQLYHFEWGFVDRESSGILPSQEQVRAHVPKKMQFIALPPGSRTKYALDFFPTFSEQGRSPMLPGFTIFAQPAPGPSSESGR